LSTHSFVVKEHLLEGQKVGEREQHVKYLLTNLIFMRPVRQVRVKVVGRGRGYTTRKISVTKLLKTTGQATVSIATRAI